jgi:hypothetical protein
VLSSIILGEVNVCFRTKCFKDRTRSGSYAHCYISPKSGSHNAKKSCHHDELTVHAARCRSLMANVSATRRTWVAAIQPCKLYRCYRAYEPSVTQV